MVADGEAQAAAAAAASSTATSPGQQQMPDAASLKQWVDGIEAGLEKQKVAGELASDQMAAVMQRLDNLASSMTELTEKANQPPYVSTTPFGSDDESPDAGKKKDKVPGTDQMYKDDLDGNGGWNNKNKSQATQSSH